MKISSEKNREYCNRWKKNHPETARLSKYNYFLKAKGTLEWKYNEYKGNAKRRDLVFRLSFGEFCLLLSQRCHYCIKKVKVGIDRKNNKVGYTMKNSVSCCWTCNNRKQKQTYKNFKNKITEKPHLYARR